MFKAIRGIWMSIGAVFAILKIFCVRWFLPLHSNEYEDEITAEQDGYEEDS
ncbi:MAG: hypothetical protein NTY46_16390 [Candidatus Sumerlaeota bacterium]|nr:hypothetical protein [Candidatus Sumerlaeota bacterium]